MQTSCFANLQNFGRDLFPVAITRGNARGMPRGSRYFRELAPTREMLKMPYEKYRPLFDEILRQLDPAEAWHTLHGMTEGWKEVHGIAHDVEPVLLCFENPDDPSELTDPAGKWCHRRMAAAWFEQALGVTVPEWSPNQA